MRETYLKKGPSVQLLKSVSRALSFDNIFSIVGEFWLEVHWMEFGLSFSMKIHQFLLINAFTLILVYLTLVMDV